MVKITLLFDNDNEAKFVVEGSPLTSEEKYLILSNAHDVLDKALEPLRGGYNFDTEDHLALYELWFQIEMARREEKHK